MGTMRIIVAGKTYEIGNPLGRGACGVVRLAIDCSTRLPCAIKFIERKGLDGRYLKSEILNHRVLDHPHVVRFEAVYTHDFFICIIMEYANGGNLRSYLETIGRMEENQARFIFQQLVIAVDYCHQKGVTNRDLKLENTLLHWERADSVPLVKVCDFGFSKSDHQSLAKSRVGTLAYMAPEVILNQKRSSYNGKLADVWSMGVMLYYMLCAVFPFAPKNNGTLANINMADQAVQQTLIRQIADAQWGFPADRPLTADCKDLLRRMICPAGQRLDLAGLQRHPWFLRDLDPSARVMNQQLLARSLRGSVQSEHEIAAELAKAVPTGAGTGPLDYDDAMIDAMIDHEEHGHSSMDASQ